MSTAISIHAPRAGRDTYAFSLWSSMSIFQSTRPVRGATTIMAEVEDLPLNFNPRAPCGARPGHLPGGLQVCGISIHAPRAGRDGPAESDGCPGHYFNPRAPCGARPVLISIRPKWVEFQSTRPVRGATRFARPFPPAIQISIHAPRAGRDWWSFKCSTSFSRFQSTRPVRGATRAGI